MIITPEKESLYNKVSSDSQEPTISDPSHPQTETQGNTHFSDPDDLPPPTYDESLHLQPPNEPAPIITQQPPTIAPTTPLSNPSTQTILALAKENEDLQRQLHQLLLLHQQTAPSPEPHPAPSEQGQAGLGLLIAREALVRAPAGLRRRIQREFAADRLFREQVGKHRGRLDEEGEGDVINPRIGKGEEVI